MLDANYAIAVYVLVLGTLFTWLFRRLGLVDVIGYIFGGIVIALTLNILGLDVTPHIPFTELLGWIGLVLFSFRIGTSINVRELHLSRAIALELIVCIIQWVVSGFIASTLELDLLTRTTLFLIMINSSSIAIISLEKTSLRMNLGRGCMNTAYIQTHVEDLIQFILFTSLIISGINILQPIQIVSQVVKVCGLIMIQLYSAKLILKYLSRSSLMLIKENKFFTSVTIAFLYASTATLIGVPPLIGAFIAGIALSLYSDLSDISEKLDGLRDIGLLFYFTSLGFRFYLGLVSSEGTYTLVVLGIMIGLITFFSRALGVFIGSLLSGLSARDCIMLSLFLTPLSEVGIVFVDVVLGRDAMLGSIEYMLITAILTSLITFSVVIPRFSTKIIDVEERLIPRSIIRFINLVSREYMRRLSVALVALTKVTIFTSISLIVSYVNSVVTHTASELGLSTIIAVSSIASSITIFLTFMIVMRSIISLLVVGLTSGGSDPLSRLLDIVIGGIALLLQIYIFYDTIRFIPEEPLHVLTALSTVSVVAITAYELIKYLRRQVVNVGSKPN